MANWFREEQRAARIPLDGSPAILLTYACLSVVYRVFVISAILWAVYYLLKPYHFQSLTVLIGGIAVFGMLMPVARQIWRAWQNPTHMNLNPRRTRLAILALLATILVLLFIPFPSTVRVPFIVESKTTKHMVATVDGWLQQSVAYADQVEPGDVVAVLRNPELEKEQVAAAGEVAGLRRSLENFRLQANLDNRFLAQIPAAAAALASAEDRLKTLLRKQERLEITSPIRGIVLAPPLREDTSVANVGAANDGIPVSWSGTALQPANAGCFIRKGDPICLISPPGQMQALAFAGQDVIELVNRGAEAKVLLAELPGPSVAASVVAISNDKVARIPAPLAATGEIPVAADMSPVEPTYFLTLTFDDPPHVLRHGSTGIARLTTPPRTIMSRISRVIRRTFRFQL